MAEPAVGEAPMAEVAVDPGVDVTIAVSVFCITSEEPNEDNAVFTEPSVVTSVEAGKISELCTGGTTTIMDEPRPTLPEDTVPDGIIREVADPRNTIDIAELDPASTREDVALAMVVPVVWPPAAGEEVTKPPGLVEAAELSTTLLGRASKAEELCTKEVDPPELIGTAELPADPLGRASEAEVLCTKDVDPTEVGVVDDGTGTGATSEGEVVPDDSWGGAEVDDMIISDVVVGGGAAILRMSEAILHRRTAKISTVGAGPHAS